MSKKRKGINWRILIVSFILVFLVAFVGSLFTSPNTSTDWYESIKPDITPPSFIFPIVWNILFVLIAISLYFSCVNAKDKKAKWWVRGTFLTNFILNILWSVIYFGLKNPKAAFVEIIFLWLSIISMMVVAYKVDKKAGWLLVPYFLWVTFASVLNFLSF